VPFAPARTVGSALVVDLPPAALVEAQSAVVEYGLPDEPVVAVVEAAADSLLPAADDDDLDLFASDDLDLYFARPSLGGAFLHSDDDDDDDEIGLIHDTPTRASRGAAFARPSLGAAFESDDDSFDISGDAPWLSSIDEDSTNAVTVSVVVLSPADILEAKRQAGLVPCSVGPVMRKPVERTRPSMLALVSCELATFDEETEDDMVDASGVTPVVVLDAEEEDVEDEVAFDWSSPAGDDDVEDESLVEPLPVAVVVHRKPRAARYARNRPSTLALSALMLANVDEVDEQPEEPITGNKGADDSARVDGGARNESALSDSDALIASEAETVGIPAKVIVQAGEFPEPQASLAASTSLAGKVKGRLIPRPRSLLSHCR
jgi:hypothetical protein